MSTISLTHPTAGAGGTPATLELPDQLSWPDEFAWQQVEQDAQHTTTGALVLDAWVKQAGRPITLQGDETRAWCERGPLLTLRAWAGQAGIQFSLALRGQTHTVVFDHGAGAIEATPVMDWSAPQDHHPYAITLRFLEL